MVAIAVLAGACACGQPPPKEKPAAKESKAAGPEAKEAEKAEVKAVAKAEAPEGLEQILTAEDGRYTKAGWKHHGPGHFELDPATGVLTSHGGMGLFWYAEREFSDFVLELDFKCTDAETNSGVFVRVPAEPTSDDYIHHSFEIQINDAGDGIHRTGAVYDAEAPTELASKPPGEWNHFKITFVGKHLEVELNGRKVVDWEAEPRGKIKDFAPSGYIGLQNHDDRSPVYFRNIYAKALK
jgi:hypothetical protein